MNTLAIDSYIFLSIEIGIYFPIQDLDELNNLLYIK